MRGSVMRCLIPITLVVITISSLSCNPTETREILFSSASGPMADSTTVIDILAMNEDGSSVRKLTSSLGKRRMSNFPVWSPNGDKIAFIVFPLDPNAYQALHIMDASGERDTVLVRLDTLNVMYPEWSPDGQKLSIIGGAPSPDGYRGWIYTVNADGTELRRVSNSFFSTSVASWLPNGDSLLVSEMPEFQPSRILRMSVDSGETDVLLESDTILYAYPAASPDGTTILFSGFIFDVSADVQKLKSLRIYRMSPNGTDVREFVGIESLSNSPRWSFDGQYVVFHGSSDPNIYNMDPSARFDKFEVFITGRDGKNLIQLTNNTVADIHPSW